MSSTCNLSSEPALSPSSYSVGQLIFLQQNYSNNLSNQNQKHQHQSLNMSNVRQIDENIYLSSLNTPQSFSTSNILLTPNVNNQLEDEQLNLIPSAWNSTSQLPIINDENQYFEQNHFTQLSAHL